MDSPVAVAEQNKLKSGNVAAETKEAGGESPAPEQGGWADAWGDECLD